MDDKDAWIAELKAKLDEVEDALEPLVEEVADFQKRVVEVMNPYIERMQAFVAEVRSKMNPPG